MLVKYKDRCVISRTSSEIELDEYGNYLSKEVYSGVCEYQKGTRLPAVMVEYSDRVFIPSFVEVEENDTIVITTSRGRTINAVITSVFDREFTTFSDNSVTEIEIKNSVAN